MFACLYVPPPAMRGASSSSGDTPDVRVLIDIARTVSPRVAARGRHQVVIDIEGLERLAGDRVLSATACARPQRAAALDSSTGLRDHLG